MAQRPREPKPRPAAWQAPARARLLLEELEPRILFSADAAALLGLQGGVALPHIRLLDEPARFAPESAQTSSVSSQTTTPALELIFIDSRVPDALRLADELMQQRPGPRMFDVVVLRADADGMQQINQGLASEQQLAAVHIISHGTAGTLLLGNTVFDAAELNKNSALVAAWGQALAADGDLLLYGCDVGSGAVGAAFVNQLAVLTGADVAASNNRTGSAALGGDWALEVASGPVQTPVALGSAQQAAYTGALDITSNLVARYTFDTNANDFSGNGYNGTLTNGAFIDTTAVSNKIGGGKVSLDGTNDYVSLDARTANFSALSQGTISAWIKNTTGNSVIFSSSDTADTESEVTLRIRSTGQIKFMVSENNTNLLDVDSTASVNDGNWHHIVMVVSASGNKLYIDGAQAVVSYVTGNSASNRFFDDVTNQNSTSIGRNLYSGGVYQPFNGFIDDTRVYSRALTAADVTELYNFTGAGITVSATAGLLTTEAGGTASFTVVLDSAPTANVTIPVSSSDTSEGTVSTASLVFTSANWATPQTVTVTGVNDALVDGFQGYSVVLGAATSADASFNGLNPSDVQAANSDDDINYGLITVDTTADTADGNTSSLANLAANRGADGMISLREAITAANNTVNGAGGADRIHFNIAAALVGGAHTITTGSSLPSITGAVIIDASTEPDYAANTPVVRIDGATAGAGVDGLTLSGTSDGSTLRGLMITRFTRDGISIQAGADNITLAGNWIGTTGTGSTGVGNGDDGIDIAGSLAVIGGTGATDRNVITNSADEGINIIGTGVTGHVIQGNYVGVDPDGATGNGNTDVGIAVISGTGNTIGGSSPAARNVISKNWEGVEINTSNNFVHGNYIGTDAAGILNRGNRLGDGIQIQGTAANNRIGGIAIGEGNLIAFNAGDGISVLGSNSGNAFRGNSISSNTGLGIDLNNDGVTANDANDADAGPNALKNFPVVTLATTSGSIVTVSGTLHTVASLAHTIDFYSSASADGTGFGEGATYLGSTAVTTDGAGNASFTSVSFAGAVPVGHFISAVTIDLASGNTSEFSRTSSAVSSTQATITVDTGSDTADGDTTSLSTLLANKGADGFVSLREAITAANNTPNGTAVDLIQFNIAGGGIQTIIVGATGLPNITNPVLIDGWSQAGYSSTPVLQLNGNNAGSNLSGLTLAAGSSGSTIRGFIINRFTASGIVVSGSNNQTIQGNWIGLNAAGTAASANADNGIYVTNSSGTLIGGSTPATRNVLSGNTNRGIYFIDADNNTISGNYVGTDVTGLLDVNGSTQNLNQSGIVLSTGSSGNTVGGLAAGSGNLVSGNNHYGIELQSASQNNLVQGNCVGTTLTGLAARPNVSGGMSLWGAGTGNVIGGSASGARNIISGNTGEGVLVGNANSGGTIQGNYIGLGIDGNTALGNGTNGIYVYGASTGLLIGSNADGSNDAAERNVISGNLDNGIEIFGAGTTGVVVQGNYIGVDATGTLDRGNTFSGAVIAGGATGNFIGGTAIGAGNVLSGNNDNGVAISDAGTSNNLVQGNNIGLNAAQSATLGNSNQGIWIGASATNNMVGGTTAAAGNTVTGAGFAGVEVNSTGAKGNALLGNRIYGNGNLGIDLSGNGVSLNDFNDGDGDSNNLQNTPLLSVAYTNASTSVTVEGTLNTNAVVGYFRIEFFASATLDSNGHGEGQVYLGSVNVTTDSGGRASFNTTLAANVAAGQFITATATKSNAAFTTFTDTSEFSLGIAANLSNSAASYSALLQGGGVAFDVKGMRTNGAFSGGSVTPSLVIAGVPAGATVVKAWLYVTTLDKGTVDTGYTLAGNSVTAVAVSSARDTGWTSGGVVTMKADVSAIVTGNGTFALAGANTLGADDYEGAVLVVVYSDTSVATRNIVTVNDRTTSITDSNGSIAIGFNAGASIGSPPSAGTLYLATLDGQSSLNDSALFFQSSSAASATSVLPANSFGGANGGATKSSIDISALINAGDSGATLTQVSNNSLDYLVYAFSATVVSVNVPPVNTVPGAQSTAEDTFKVFSSATSNQISISDSDAGAGNNEVTLSVTNGTLSLFGTTGLTFTAGDGTTDTSMTFRGTAAAINTALNGLRYFPTADYAGSATLSVATKDALLVSLDIDAALLGRYTFENAGALGTDTSPAAGFAGTPSGVTAVVDATRGNVLGLAGAGSIQTTGRYGDPANVTLAAWVNLTAADSNGAEVISLGNSVMLRLQENGTNVLSGTFYNGSTWIQTGYDVGFSLASTGWHHVAFSFNNTGDKATLYLDGVAVKTTTTTDSISYTLGANSFIGKHGNGGTTWDFSGRVDDARIYSRVLTAAEVATLAADLALLDTDTVAITVTAVNDAPMLIGIGTALNYGENAAAAAVASGISVTDADNTHLSSATVSISMGFTTAEDTLAFADQNGISGSWNASTGVLSLSGSATVVNYQTALRAVTYFNSSDAPNTAARTVSFVANDGALNSTTYDRNINVLAFNDAPTASNLNAAESYAEETNINLINIVASDVDSANITATLTLSDINAGSLLLGTSNAVVSSYNAATGVWMASGALADVNVLLAGVTYLPATDYNGSFSIATRIDDGVAPAITGSKTVTGTAVNDAPTLGNGTLAAVAEDSANPAGQSVSTVFTGQFADVDAGATFSGMAVVANAAHAGTQGAWQYSSNGGTNWFAIGTVADGATALAVSSSTLIRFLPVTNFNGTPTALTVRGLDNSYAGAFSTTVGSETRVTVNTTTSGTSTAIAAATASLSTSITAVNDAPVAVADSATAVEAGGTANGSAGTDPTGAVLSNDTDVDTSDTQTVIGVAAGTVGSAIGNVALWVTGSFGSITVAANGAFTYTVDNSNPTVQALRASGDTLSDVFTYTVQDTAGLTSSTQITVTLQGANDAPSALALVAAAPTNLLVNGSFETNNGGANSSSSGAGVTVAGWTALGGEGFEVWNNFNAGGPATASDGISRLEIDVSAAGVNGIAQSVSTTLNQDYVISFDFSGRLGNTDVLNVFWRNTLVGTVTQTSVGWLTYNFIVTGSGGLDELRFMESASQSDGVGELLDNVRLFVGASLTVTAAENSANGTVVGRAVGFDVDAGSGDTTAYSLPVDAGGRFAINGSTGQITVANGSLLDFEAASSHTVTVRATDQAGLTFDRVITISLSNVNETPVFSNLNGSPTYVENGAPVLMDVDVQVADAELGASNNYGGATLSLARNGGASAQDQFSFDGFNVTSSGANVSVGGVQVGTFVSAGGQLVVTFGASATQARVNTLMQNLLYANSSEAPPATVLVDWTFNDGNAGAQGSGGALSATGSVVVSITSASDAPTASNLNTAEAYTEDTAVNLTDIVISDVDSASVTATLTLSNIAAGALNTGTSGAVTSTYSAGTGVWAATGVVADVNALLAALIFTPAQNFNGNFTLATSVSDGALSVAGSKSFTATAVNDAPTLTDRALFFDGSDQVVVPGQPSLVVSATITIEALVQRTGALSATQLIVNKEGEYEIGISATGKLQWAFANGAPGWAWVETAYTVPVDTWVQLAVTYNSGVVKAYANGSLVDTQAASGNIGDVYPALNDLTIGGRQNSAVQRFVGLVDEVRVWNVERSGAQILAASAATLTGAEAGLVGYWRFSEVSGTTALDSSPQGNHGVLGNGVPADEPTRTTQLDHSLAEDSPLNVLAPGLLNKATDPDGMPLTAVLITGPAHAAAFVLNADGSFNYTPNANYSGSDSFVFVASDGLLSSAPATVVLNIAPVQDAPTLRNAVLAPVAEDTAGPPGQAINVVFAGQFADADAGSSFSGIAVVGNTADAGTQGVWQYSSNAGANWFAIGTVADNTTALALSSSTWVRFVPLADYNGTPTALVVRGLDNTYGGGFSSTAGTEARASVDTTSNGGSTAIAAATATLSTSITAVNDAPVVTTTGTVLAYAENAAATAVDSAVTVTDIDSANLSGATVTISANYASGQDVLAFTDQLGITGSWVAGTGVLTLSGSATVANYQTALRNITYVNSSDSPSALTRTVSWVVNDGAANSNTAARGISVAAVNDAPTASNLSAAESYTEDTALNLTDIVISDVDSASVTATLTLSSAAAGALNTGTSGAVTSTYNAGTGVWTASGALADVNALLAALTFTPTPDFNANFSISTSVSDGSLSANGSKAFTGTAVNDAPVITSDGGGASAALAQAENITAVTTVAASDVDGGAAVFSVLAGGDAALFSINASTGALRFVAAPDFETPLDVGANNVYDLTVQVSDGAGGFDTQAISVTVTDVSNALVVTTTANANDTGMGASFTAEQLNANQGPDGAVSLREALIASNTTAGTQTVTFNIAGTGVHTISPTAALPAITGAVVLDATSDDSFAANGNRPAIVLDGNNGAFVGLQIDASGGGSTIQGLVIRDFGSSGIFINAGSNGNTLIGNYVGGLEATGSSAGGGENNAGSGIVVQGANNTVGGTTAALRNVVSGNNSGGIVVVNAAGNSLIGNHIGTDAAGTAVVGNAGEGIRLDGASNTQIGGTSLGAGNILAGSEWESISAINATSGSVIEGNFIGTDRTGSLNLGNGSVGQPGPGISIGEVGNPSNNNRVGGTAPGAGNWIAFNAGPGISVDQNGNGASTGNAILGNRFFSNTGVAVDLDSAYAVPSSPGVTANDLGDADTGGNNRQNFPLLGSANSTGGNTTISGTFNSQANSSYRIEFFSSTVGHASGNGEGSTYLGFATITTNGGGNANISTLLNGVSVAAGDVVSATATVDLGGGNYGSTSEFAANVVATASSAGISVGAISGNTSEAGGTATFTVVLNTAPTADVVIAVSSNNLLEGTVSPSPLTFTFSNWNMPQTVTVTGVDESIFDGNRAYSVVLGAAASADAAYNGLNPADVAATNTDNDSQSTIVVLTTSDDNDGDTSSLYALLSNPGADGQISLREAITAANNSANGSGGPDRIHFNIGAALVSGLHTINLASALPAVNDTVLIDGSSEPDFGAAPVVRIDGGGQAFSGLALFASFSTVRGLMITGIGETAFAVFGNNNSIVGNYIGNDGSDALPNATLGNYSALYLAGSNNQVGGSTAADRNVISGNQRLAMWLDGVNNVISGNYVGVNAAGTAALANATGGIGLSASASNTRIGGSAAGEGNVIAGNGGSGVIVFADSARLQGNLIGTDGSGTVLVANLSAGVQVLTGADGGVVGGTGAGEGNLIAGNAGAGVLLQGGGTSVLGNRIRDNNNLGIDLQGAANAAQAAPMLFSANSTGGNTTVLGSLNSTAGTNYRIEFFSSATADASGFGEGQVYLGFVNVSTNGSGYASFATVLNGISVTAGHVVSATATVDLGAGSFAGTSEFAANVVATANTAGINASSISGNTSEAGGTATFTVVLATAPTADVTVPVSSNNLIEGTLSTALLTFTAANWNLPQTVTVTGVDENIVDGNRAYNVVLGVASSADVAYNGVNPLDVAATNTDNDTQSTLVVSTAADTADGDTSSLYALLSNPGADGQISLREAITAANNSANGSAGPDRIHFNIAGPGEHLISVSSSLPSVTAAVVIDGSTEPDFAGAPVVRIDGAAVFNGNGLALLGGSDGSTLRGLAITGFLGNGSPAGHGLLVLSNNNLVAGNSLVGNWAGIAINGAASGNLFGGSTAGDRNLISGNTLGGLAFGASSSNNRVQGNYVGVAADGSTAMGNALYGIRFYNSASNNLVGGTAAGTGNVIAHNGGAGVSVSDSASGNAVLGNRVHNNSGLGIDLGAAGITANDVGDSDIGANGLQNFPVLSGANSAAGSTTVNGTLNSAPGSQFRIEFFSNPSAEAVGYDEGQVVLGWIDVTTDGSGDASFSALLSGVSVTAGHVITATATQNLGAGVHGSTSEFSARVSTSNAPINSVPGAQSTNEDTALAISGLSVVDGDNNLASVQLSVNSGSVTLNLAGGASISAGANASSSLSLSGSQTQINAALATLVYRGQLNFNGSDTLTMLSTDALGATDSDSISINVNAVNDAPVLATSASALPYLENDSAVAVDVGLTLADIDSPNLVSAAVSITAGFAAGEDNLGFVDQNGISGVWNAGTGVLNLTGSATRAQYEAALRSVSYFNASNNPSTTTRTVSFTVNDGASASNTATRDISISAVNDAPTLTTNAGALVYVENDPATPIDPALTVGDVDSPGLTSARVTIGAGFVASEDGLVFSNQAGISGSYNTATGVLSLSGAASTAQYQTALRSVAYVNTSDNPNAAVRTVSFVVGDGGLSSLPATRDITISATNDAPLLLLSAGTLAYVENQAATAVDTALTASDVDSNNLAGATVRISAGFTAAEDGLVFNNQFGISGSYNTATGVLTLSGSASVAQYQTALRSVSYVNRSDNLSAINRSVSFEVTDGALSSNVGSRNISLAAVNDAPVVTTTASSLQVPENAGATTIDADLTVSDADNVQLSGASVQISTGFVAAEDSLVFADQNGISGSYNAASGVLTLSGSASVALYQVALRSVAYSNGSDNPSLAPRSVAFTVSDGTANSGVAYRFLDLNAANDAPRLIGSGGSLNFIENDAPAVVDAGLLVQDVDHTSLAGATVRFVAGYVRGQDNLLFVDTPDISGNWNVATGVLTLSGTASLADYQAALRSVAYVNSSDNMNTVVRTLAFQVIDAAVPNTAGNFSNVVTRDITLIAVNDAPTATHLNTPQRYTEGVALQLVAMVVSDVDSAGLASDIDAVLTLSNPLAGTLNSGTVGTAVSSFDIGTGVWRASGSLADVNTLLARLVFTPRTGPGVAGNFNADFSIGTRITDAAGASISGSKQMLAVSANDEQVLALNAGLTVLENSTGSVISDSVLRTNDVDNRSDELLYTLLNTPEHGSLRLDGLRLGVNARFSQAHIDQGRLQYDHDGSETAADGFAFQVDDGAGAVSTGVFNITVLPVNDQAPVITSHGGGAAAEVQANEGQTALGRVLAQDSDLPAAALRYSINGGADAALFSIDALTGVLAFINAPDFELPLDADANNLYELTVVADDGRLSDSQDLRVRVQPRNDNSPRFTSPANLSVDENTRAVVRLTAVDADLPATALRYSIVGGADAARFGIDENTGALAFLLPPNFEAPGDADGNNLYQLIVQATDGELNSQQSLRVQVQDVNEAPLLAGQNSSLPEGGTLRLNLAAGAADPDLGANGQLNLASAVLVQSPAHGSLSFAADGTALYVHDGSEPQAAAAFDSFSYTLRDAAGLVSNVALVRLGVTPVNDAPSLTLLPLSINGGGSVVLSADQWQARDADHSAANLVFVVAGVSQGRFEHVVAPGLAVSRFTQADVAVGAIRLVSLNGSQTPAFSVEAFDGQAFSMAAQGRVEFIANLGLPAPSPEPMPTPTPEPSPTPTASNPLIPSPSPSPSPTPEPAVPSAPAVSPAPAAESPASGPGTSLTEALALNELPQLSGSTAGDESGLANSRPAGRASAPDFSTTGTRNVVDDTAPLAFAGPPAALSLPAWNGLDLGIFVPTDGPFSGSNALRTLDTATITATRASLQAAPAYNDNTGSNPTLDKSWIDLSSAEVGQMTGVALTAGTVWWALHTGGAMTGLLFSLPTWRHADLLAVLPDDDDKVDDDADGWNPPEDDEAARDEQAVGALLDPGPEGGDR